MKDQTLILQNQQLWKALGQVAEGLKISVLSQSLRDTALIELLIKKGLFTKEEYEASVKEQAQAMVAEAQKQTSGLVTPAGSDQLIIPATELPPSSTI